MKIKLSLTTQIATALVLAVIAGVLLQGHPGFVNEYIKPFGTIFLNLLKFIVVPLVLFSIMAGILSMNDMSKLGKLGLRAVLYFAFTTVIAVTMGLVVSTLVRGWIPAINLHIEKTGESVGMPEVSFMDQIVGMFPDNILTPLSSMAMIQVIVIAILFGSALGWGLMGVGLAAPAASIAGVLLGGWFIFSGRWKKDQTGIRREADD